MNYVFNIASNCSVVNNFYNGGQPPLGGSERPIPEPQLDKNAGKTKEVEDKTDDRTKNETSVENKNNPLVDANGFMTVPPYHDLKPTEMPIVDPDIIPKPTRRGTRFAYLRNIDDSPEYHFPPRELIEAELDKGTTSVLVKNGEEVEAEFDPPISYADGREKNANYETQTNSNADLGEQTMDNSTRRRRERGADRRPRAIVNQEPKIYDKIALQVQKLNAEPKVEPEINSGNQEIKIEQTRVNSLPTVEVVASTPSVEIIAPSNERNSVPKENNSPPIEEIRLETIVVEPTETIPVEVKSIETKPIVNPQSEEPKGKLKLRDMNSVKTVLDEIYGLWSINLMEKLKIDPSKAHLEEPARKSMQKMIIENIINDLTDNVNLNSLEMSYNKVCSILQNRRFPMENMISKEQFCYERTD